MHRSITLAAAFTIWVGMAHADAFTDSVVTNLQELGYDVIEIKNGPTQIKVEAIRGSVKLETIFDCETGEILKREVGRAGADDMGRTGIEIDTRNDDFLGDDDEDDEDDRIALRGGGDDDEDDDSDEDDESDDDEDDEG